MTAALVAHAAQDIQTRRILHAVKPEQCPEADCTLFYDAAVASRCDYHQARAAAEWMKRQQCLYEGCGLETSRPDPYGLCPEHTSHLPNGDRDAALEEIADTYGLQIVGRQSESPPMVISPHDYDRAVDLLAPLNNNQKAKLRATPPSYPLGVDWQLLHGSRYLPRWIAGVARAVATGNYIIEDERV